MHYYHYGLLASPMEMPGGVALLYLCLCPVHLRGGMFSFYGTKGIEAAWFQGIALFALLLFTVLVLRSRKSSNLAKIAVLPVGYPVVILLSNLIPNLTFMMTGSFYQP